jgi:CHASE2 domain-containing sensor protein
MFLGFSNRRHGRHHGQLILLDKASPEGNTLGRPPKLPEEQTAALIDLTSDRDSQRRLTKLQNAPPETVNRISACVKNSGTVLHGRR